MAGGKILKVREDARSQSPVWRKMSRMPRDLSPKGLRLGAVTQQEPTQLSAQLLQASSDLPAKQGSQDLLEVGVAAHEHTS